MRQPRLLPGLLAVLALACGSEGGAPAARAGAGGPSAADRPVILAIGTSLTAGLGVEPEEAWPALLQARLDSLGLPYEVVNAGVSGETSAGALRRAGWLLQRSPAVLILETGANDGLRGQDPDSLRAHLEAILDLAAAATPPPRVLLAGMEAPRNWGPRYVARFRAVYREVAEARAVPLVPFLLEGVAAVDSLNQADGIHPNPAGHRRVAEGLWLHLEPLLRSGAAQ
jgi:acyl-CoA thioesterase-1